VKKGIKERPYREERETIFIADRVNHHVGEAESSLAMDDDELDDELDDLLGGDDLVMQKFREARIAEMKEKREKDKFGSVAQVLRHDSPATTPCHTGFVAEMIADCRRWCRSRRSTGCAK
jgi:hypothetical protein